MIIKYQKTKKENSNNSKHKINMVKLTLTDLI